MAPLQRRLARQRGQGLVEFAVVFPLIVFFLFAIFEVGLGLNRQATLQHAAREGARAAAVIDGTGTSCADVQARASSQSQGLVPTAAVVIDYPDGTSDAGDPVDVNLSYTFRPVILRSAVDLLNGLFGTSVTAGDVDIDVTGSSRLERDQTAC